MSEYLYIFSYFVINFLARIDVCVASAFAYGFFSSLDKKMIENPLSRMFEGCLKDALLALYTPLAVILLLL